MTYLLAALVAATILALVAVAWRWLPTDTVARPVEAVDPTAPWAYVDHRDTAQRATDQATVNDAWGLR